MPPTEKSLAALAPLALVIILAFGGLQYYHLNRDLDSVQDRAQIAANPQDMLGYLRTDARQHDEVRSDDGPHRVTVEDSGE